MFRFKHTLLFKSTFIFLFTCIFFSVSAQVAPPASLRQSFDAYHKNRLVEKLFVHTDKTFYLAGEPMWFKVYCVAGNSHQPIDISKLAYVEVLDGTNRPVMQGKIALKDGMGSGSFVLPASVGTGTYRFRAYTAWMKNFSPEFYFTKALTIANTLKGGILSEATLTTTSTAQFFPEGGQMVAGLQSRLAFRVADPQDRGLQCAGLVLDEKGDTVARFSATRFGIGRFDFTPQAGHQYKAIVSLPDGATISAPLPKVAETGYVLRVDEKSAEQLEVTVLTNLPETETVYLLAHSQQKIGWAAGAALHNSKAVFSINKSALGDGISQLTLFDAAQRPRCERLYFKMPEHRLGITANSDASEYGTRKKVALAVNTQLGPQPAPAGVSMAVFRLDSLTTPASGDIFSYLWLSSDLQGTVESPGYYFTAKGTEASTALDNLMLTHGWRRFRWEEVLQQQPPLFRYVPEYKGPIVSAKITHANTGLPAAGVAAYLSVPGTQVQFYGAKSDSAGDVLFHTKPFYGPVELIVQTNAPKDSAYKVTVANSFSDRYTAPPAERFKYLPQLQPLLVRYSVGTQVQASYAQNDLEHFLVPVVDSLPFYGPPSSRYLLDDYTRFTTMEEVLREYVVEVAVRKRAGQYIFPVLRDAGSGYFEGDPLVLVDGVPQFDNNPVMAYDPLKVRKIEVVASRYFYGPFTYDGIINFTTYNGTLDGFQLDPRALVVDYEGLQLQRAFYAPQYENAQKVASRMPDFRSLLYWNPDLRTGANGKAEVSFYTSDAPGTYIGVIQGMDKAGACGSGYFQVEVK